MKKFIIGSFRRFFGMSSIVIGYFFAIKFPEPMILMFIAFPLVLGGILSIALSYSRVLNGLKKMIQSEYFWTVIVSGVIFVLLWSYIPIPEKGLKALIDLIIVTYIAVPLLVFLILRFRKNIAITILIFLVVGIFKIIFFFSFLQTQRDYLNRFFHRLDEKNSNSRLARWSEKFVNNIGTKLQKSFLGRKMQRFNKWSDKLENKIFEFFVLLFMFLFGIFLILGNLVFKIPRAVENDTWIIGLGFVIVGIWAIISWIRT